MIFLDSPEVLFTEALDLLKLKQVNIDSKEQIYMERHCHSYYELYVILRGSYTINVENKEINVENGTAFLIPPGIYHMTQGASDDLARVSLSFKFDQEKAQEITDRINFGVYSFEIDDDLLNLCKKTFRGDSNAEFYSEEILSVLTILLIHLLRDIGVGGPKKKKKKDESLEDYRVRIIDNFFDEHSFKNITNQMLADELYVSIRQLNRIMKKAYGLTFNQKLIAGRMDRAAWLLRTTDKTVNEISLQVGYESKSYFYRAFQAQYKMSPNEYRKKIKEENI